MSEPKIKVLVAPLNWGLGHATRCIPIIRELIAQNAEVVIGAEGDSATLLNKIFPSLEIIIIPGTKVRYSKILPLPISIFLQIPSILQSISKEHSILQKIIEDKKITHIISDNRFGVYSKFIPSVFITHQVSIKAGRYLKFLEPALLKANKSYINKFRELWIPDIIPPNNLSGDLADFSKLDIQVHYIGILSRFQDVKPSPQKKYESIALLSGPEPQRTLLEKKLIVHFKSTKQKCLLIQGKPGPQNNRIEENVEIYNEISDEEFINILHPETTLYCRSGYSTLMDLCVLKHNRVVLIPTPGQTEQEYLAEYLSSKYNFNVVDQNSELNNVKIAESILLPYEGQQELLTKRIRLFLESV